MKIRKLGFVVGIFLVLGWSGVTLAQDANPSQFFGIIKRLFPETGEVAIFISPELIATQKEVIDRSAVQNQIQARIHVVESGIDVGKSIRELQENSLLVIFSSDVLMTKSSKLYILSKCKEKQISIVTSSRDYSESGALLGLVKNEKNRIELVLNLKHSEHLKAKFTEDFIAQAGIKEVIQ